MNKPACLITVFCLFSPVLVQGQTDLIKSVANLEPHNVLVESSSHQKKNSIRVIEDPGIRGEALALIKGTDFKSGTIEVELSGQPRPGTDTTYRGFVGIAFRVQKKDTLAFECFYLRPTNGRSSDQLRRNHATQYVSEPQYPWFKLRKENPGVYESYVDLVPGEWTKVKIDVQDKRAKLYVHGSDQPCLVVSDLKHGITSGQIALWIGAGTEGHFRNLIVRPR